MREEVRPTEDLTLLELLRLIAALLALLLAWLRWRTRERPR